MIDSPHFSPGRPLKVHRRILLPDDLAGQAGQPAVKQKVHVLLICPPGNLQWQCQHC